MIIDMSSRPPLPQFQKKASHLDNYRRVYASSERLSSRAVGDEAFAAYMRDYDALDARAVVVKGSDVETTFNFKIENEHVADLCRRFPARFLGFAGVDPHKGKAAVAELERAVRELGMRGLDLQCFEHKLNINDPLLYPLYEKCIELDIPVNVHCGMNFSTRTRMTYGKPEYLDAVLVDLPDLRVCASPPGWPWVNELIAVAWRHPNVWIGLVAVRPKYLADPNSGYGPLLQYGRSILQDRIIFGSSFPMMPVERSVAEIRALPLGAEVEHKWLYANAAAFLRLA
ncbi:MAG TPA: amidohydrolase family protein [Dongiaceae bacterium]|nr:amidohydrolase family protein [Dongiaceae bacterium]